MALRHRTFKFLSSLLALSLRILQLLITVVCFSGTLDLFLYDAICSDTSDCMKLCYTVMIRVPQYINTHKIIKILPFINFVNL